MFATYARLATVETIGRYVSALATAEASHPTNPAPARDFEPLPSGIYVPRRHWSEVIG